MSSSPGAHREPSPSNAATTAAALGPLGAIAALAMLLAGFALSVDYPRAAGAFWSDAATYYTMAHSLAADGDMRFERRDLERVYREFERGPSGIYLKKGQELDLTIEPRIPFLVSQGPFTNDIYFAKSFLYSLAAAPFVLLFGTNGMLLLHALLLSAVVLAGYFFLATMNTRGVALAFSLSFVFASVAPAYFVWLTPELFNFCLVFLGAFFWLYKERAASPPPLLAGMASDVIAAVLWGSVTYSKPNNVFLVFVLVGLIAWRRQWKRAAVVGSVFSLALGGLFLANLAVTGDMNYQGGERKIFTGSFPYEHAEADFDSTGLSQRTDVIYTHQPWDIVLHDTYLFYIGRFSGMAIYYFPAALALVLWLASKDKRLYQWLVFAVATFGGMLLVVWSPTNYFGGGGTLGNRYFMNLFPLYFFLFATFRRPAMSMVVTWAMASVFITSILVAPFQAGRRPGEHATTGAFKWLPVELSMINHLPTNSDPRKFRQRFDDSFLGYFLDNNTWFKERRSPGGLGFHVKGGTETELVVRTSVVLTKLIVRVTNVAGADNEVRVCVPGGCETLAMRPGEKAIVELPAGRAAPYEDFGHRSYCYVVRVSSSKGTTPLLASRANVDERYLGAFVHIVTEPYPGIPQ